MKYLDEYRNGTPAKNLLNVLHNKDYRGKTLRLMEICGTHTVAIFRLGLRELLPPSLHLVSGPGCPVCVTSHQDIDRAIWSARRPGVIIATFGDLMRVPGSDSSLLLERSRGGDVRMVYGSLDALRMARDNPGKEVVFLGIGFETTAPTVAAVIVMAARDGLKNFSVFSAHKLLPPAMKVLLEGNGPRLDGFLCPGHVSTIIGAAAYEEVASRYGIPCVVTGFEDLDLLQGICMLTDQVLSGASRVENQYTRAVSREGNQAAQKILQEVFRPVETTWRGLGNIPASGLEIRERWGLYDAVRKFSIPLLEGMEHPGCRCGEVLRGVMTPLQCGLFGKGCTPQEPLGPCMVSSEGTCGAYYRYGTGRTGDFQ